MTAKIFRIHIQVYLFIDMKACESLEYKKTLFGKTPVNFFVPASL